MNTTTDGEIRFTFHVLGALSTPSSEIEITVSTDGTVGMVGKSGPTLLQGWRRLSDYLLRTPEATRTPAALYRFMSIYGRELERFDTARVTWQGSRSDELFVQFPPVVEGLGDWVRLAPRVSD